LVLPISGLSSSLVSLCYYKTCSQRCPLSLHDALPIYMECAEVDFLRVRGLSVKLPWEGVLIGFPRVSATCDYFKPARFEELLDRSEEHTSELQSRENLVCRLLLEKKK